MQALAFLSFIVIKSGGLLAGLVSVNCENLVGTLLLVGMFYLIFRAFRTVYGQSRLRSAISMALVFIGYSIVLLAAMVGLVSASISLLTSRG